MDVEIGYFPKHYYCDEPDAGGFFPFAIEGTTKYVFDISNIYLPKCDENWLPLWMEKLKAYPIYFCAQIPSYWKEEYVLTCKKSNIGYRNLFDTDQFSVLVTQVEGDKQFRKVIPFFISLGSGNDLVLWSMSKDVFSIEKRKWKGNWKDKIAEAVIVKIEGDTSIFWIGYDGDSIAVISNNPQFSTYEKICRTFPEFINPTQCEYE
ncbi:hypothetical protein [uncultured Metabacillus sp.]|uniref:hypothetical protein n=1 Tax=uncultured Metabacillus sp. TaxID=2860135 RepID=UPI0026389894|nr:hypothetical protein [uncultured Metabacillus sp.]